MSESTADIRRIPENAQRRLEEMRGRDGGPPRLFTSDLSVNEFLMVEQAGFEPVGFVMGSSFFHIGIQWTMQPFQNYELDVLTAALYHAREYAMARMEEEAHMLDADGVVGVRLEVGRHDWAEAMAEFTRWAPRSAPARDDGRRYRKPDGRPFTSDLSGQEFWTLLRTGCRPVELAMGNCVYHVGHRGFRQALAQHRAQRRDAQLHPGALQRPRAGAGADAGGGRVGAGPRDRGRAGPAGQPRMGQPRDRVPGHRHGRRAGGGTGRSYRLRSSPSR